MRSFLLAALLAGSAVRSDDPFVDGRLLTVDGGSARGLRVRVNWGVAVDTVFPSADGRFSVLRRMSLGDSVPITVESVAGVTYQPVQLTVPLGRLARPLHILVFPRDWQVEGGSYGGERVRLDLESLFERGRGQTSFAKVRFGEIIGWTPESFPIPIVVLATADSAAFWAIAREVETTLGMPLFRPAGDTLIQERIYPVDVRVDARVGVNARTFVSWNRRGEIYEGSVTFRSRGDMRDAATVGHELMHVLGFGHTDAWRSILSPRYNGVRGLSATDVANAQVLMRVMELQRAADLLEWIPARTARR